MANHYIFYYYKNYVKALNIAVDLNNINEFNQTHYMNKAFVFIHIIFLRFPTTI